MSKNENFDCIDCKGTTFNSNVCENPSCPNMPCCGRPRPECDCVEK